MQKIWIFTFNQQLSEELHQVFDAALRNKLSEWAAHKVPVQSKVLWEARQLLVVEALSDVSGCSIDWLTHLVQALAGEYQLQLCNPTAIPVQQSENSLALIPLSDLIAGLRNGQVSTDAIVYDYTVVHHNTLSGWKKPLAESWIMARV
jgi:hypothetical protein